MSASDRLSDGEIEEFIERGYLWLRGAFAPEKARAIVEGVFGPNGSLERCYKRTSEGVQSFPYAGQPLNDCRAWPNNRVDVDTGFQTTIESLSPRLHRAMRQLVGPAGVRRTCVGEKWILNLDYAPEVPAADELDRVRRGARWHIDTPGPRTTLTDRFDALTLLILWSDVEEHGGGTLFAPDSLDRMVEALATSAEGIDTKSPRFADSIIAACKELRAQTGKAGDVLLTHPFMLHARPQNYRLAVRILENPTAMAHRELDYRPSNPAPSPVEACVIRRLRALPSIAGPLRARDEAHALEDRARARLVEAFPSYFLPYLEGRSPSWSAEQSKRIELVDRFLFASWIEHRARGLAYHNPDPLSAARAAVQLARTLMATQRDAPRLPATESLHEPETLARRSYATLVLGLVNCEGINFVVSCLLRAMGYQTYAFETAPTRDGHRHTLLLLVSEGKAAFVDAWSQVATLWVDGFDVAGACEWTPGYDTPKVSGPIEGTPLYGEVCGPGGDLNRLGLAPRDAFLGGRLLEPWMLDFPPSERLGPSRIARDAALEQARLAAEAFCREEQEAEAASADGWKAFLRLRLRQLEGKLDDAEKAYTELLGEQRLRGSTRRLVRVLGHLAGTRSTDGDGASKSGRDSGGARAPAFDIDGRMRRGDTSVWPRWNPRLIEGPEMRSAWTDVLTRRGEPGVPAAIRAYTHFAYCASSCNFCMYWHQVPKAENAYERHIGYLVRQIDWYRSSFGRVPIGSAYCGGGTPTATPSDQLARYLDAFTAAFEVQGEFTVEGHPRTMDVEKVRLLAAAGVNRLSMGLQSFEHEVLVRITRRNAPEEHLREIVDAATRASMVVNLDLVLGLPGQTLESFRSDVVRATALGPAYITLYLYEPVLRLPQPPPEEMTYTKALTPELLAQIAESGYCLADPLLPGQRSARLRRVGHRDRYSGAHVYAQFDERPSHTIALGPGSYGHVFGRFWYREATSMAFLDRDEPQYIGTALGLEDECRSIVLNHVETGQSFAPSELSAVTGVDVREAFAPAFERAEQLGMFVRRGERYDVVDCQGREQVIDLLVPRRPAIRKLAIMQTDRVEPELVAMRRDEEEIEVERALLRDYREALRIPERGRLICRNVWVGRSDGASIYFHVGEPRVPPLRVNVAGPSEGEASWFATEQFAISYATASGGSPNELERRFLAWLKARTVAAARGTALAPAS